MNTRQSSTDESLHDSWVMFLLLFLIPECGTCLKKKKKKKKKNFKFKKKKNFFFIFFFFFFLFFFFFPYFFFFFKKKKKKKKLFRSGGTGLFSPRHAGLDFIGVAVLSDSRASLFSFGGEHNFDLSFHSWQISVFFGFLSWSPKKEDFVLVSSVFFLPVCLSLFQSHSPYIDIRPWIPKFLYGFVSDTIPLFGYRFLWLCVQTVAGVLKVDWRRKTYLVFGSGLSCFCLALASAVCKQTQKACREVRERSEREKWEREVREVGERETRQ